MNDEKIIGWNRAILAIQTECDDLIEEGYDKPTLNIIKAFLNGLMCGGTHE